MRWFLSCVALQRAGADAAAAAGDQGDGGTGKRQDHVTRHEARHVIVMLLALPVAVQVLSHSNSATPTPGDHGMAFTWFTWPVTHESFC